jgi:hypothetical protein
MKHTISKIGLERVENAISKQIHTVVSSWETVNPPPVKQLTHRDLLEMAFEDPAWRKFNIEKYKDSNSNYASVEVCRTQLIRDSKVVARAVEANDKKLQSWAAQKEKKVTDLALLKEKFINQLAIGLMPREEILPAIEKLFV